MTNKSQRDKKSKPSQAKVVRAAPNPKGIKGKQMGLQQAARKQALLEALEQSLGVVTTACKAIGIPRDFYYSAIRSDPDFKAKVEELTNVALDFAESHLHKRISEGSDAATIFYLKTKGKGRGYVERTEITGGGGAPIAIQVVTTDMEMRTALEDI